MASETRQDPDRIYLEPAPGGPEGRTWSEDDVWPLDVWPPEDRDDRPGVEYIRADLHATEIARLTRELEEAREVGRVREEAAQALCTIYFEIAADAIGEDEVRRLRDERIDALAARTTGEER